MYFRIDYFFTFSKDFHMVENCDIDTLDLSDQSLVYMQLNLDMESRSTLWRRNKNILNQVKQQVKKDIKHYLEHNDNREVPPPKLWYACKAVLRKTHLL